jgi:diphthamide synthase subunit DPH2
MPRLFQALVRVFMAITVIDKIVAFVCPRIVCDDYWKYHGNPFLKKEKMDIFLFSKF